jgi:hypothetical protein
MNVYRIIGNDLKRYIKQDDNCLYPIEISNGSHMYKLKCFATSLAVLDQHYDRKRHGCLSGRVRTCVNVTVVCYCSDIGTLV